MRLGSPRSWPLWVYTFSRAPRSTMDSKPRSWLIISWNPSTCQTPSRAHPNFINRTYRAWQGHKLWLLREVTAGMPDMHHNQGHQIVTRWPPDPGPTPRNATPFPSIPRSSPPWSHMSRISSMIRKSLLEATPAVLWGRFLKLTLSNYLLRLLKQSVASKWTREAQVLTLIRASAMRPTMPCFQGEASFRILRLITSCHRLRMPWISPSNQMGRQDSQFLVTVCSFLTR